MGYVYKKSEARLWTVGTYDGGPWLAESDHHSEDEAASRCAFLNGGQSGDAANAADLKHRLAKVEAERDIAIESRLIAVRERNLANRRFEMLLAWAVQDGSGGSCVVGRDGTRVGYRSQADAMKALEDYVFKGVDPAEEEPPLPAPSPAKP